MSSADAGSLIPGLSSLDRCSEFFSYIEFGCEIATVVACLSFVHAMFVKKARRSETISPDNWTYRASFYEVCRCAILAYFECEPRQTDEDLHFGQTRSPGQELVNSARHFRQGRVFSS